MRSLWLGQEKNRKPSYMTFSTRYIYLQGHMRNPRGLGTVGTQAPLEAEALWRLKGLGFMVCGFRD